MELIDLSHLWLVAWVIFYLGCIFGALLTYRARERRSLRELRNSKSGENQ